MKLTGPRRRRTDRLNQWVDTRETGQGHET